MKPFFTYFGGKYRSAPHYPRPVYGTIVEPFAGSAGYSVRYYMRQVILVEKDPIVAALWRYLIRVRESEIRSLPLIKRGQTVDDFKGISQEARHLIGFWMNKGSTGPRKSPSIWAEQNPSSNWGVEIRNRIASQISLIRHWIVVEGDYTKAPDIQATWFVDPPYQKAGRFYRYSSDNIDFGKLNAWCKLRKGQVMVCENEGARWLPFRKFIVIKATSGRQKREDNTSKEVLWQNDWKKNPPKNERNPKLKSPYFLF